MSRIAVLSDLWMPFPGGAERFLFNIAQVLKAYGHDVRVFTSYEKGLKAPGGIPVDFRDITGRGAQDILTYLGTIQPHVILTHQMFADKFQKELAHIPIPIIQVVHAAPRFDYIKFAIFNSEYTRSRNLNAQPQDMVSHPPA